ncbi:MAG: DsbA family protein [Candidatus Moranbacteria bacterium]|nr:DsbA family protein [Candidatus Moranbacteria bacterium]
MEENKKIEEAPAKEMIEADKKIKNLIALSILLGGLFIGSIFVDVAQLLKGNGFSQRVLNKTDVFTLDGKTWVAYSEPIVKIQVITDDSCENCQPDQALVWLRRVVPTILTQKVDLNSPEGKDLIAKTGVKTVPAFIFSSDVEKTDFYQQASALFEKKNNQFLLRTAELGLQPGKYLEIPSISENDIQVGNKEAKVKIVEFSDFQCPYCRAFHLNSISKAIRDYGDKILFVYKQFPLEFHLQAENAALASECANEQGKSLPYVDKLFEDQSNWGKLEGTQKFKSYALQLGLNSSQFNQCLDSKKYQDKVNRDKEEARSFGIGGTPSTFINDQFMNGVIAYDEIKKLIDEQLAK